jgi:hypothetical protein
VIKRQRDDNDGRQRAGNSYQLFAAEWSHSGDSLQRGANGS